MEIAEVMLISGVNNPKTIVLELLTSNYDNYAKIIRARDR